MVNTKIYRTSKRVHVRSNNQAHNLENKLFTPLAYHHTKKILGKREVGLRTLLIKLQVGCMKFGHDLAFYTYNVLI